MKKNNFSYLLVALLVLLLGVPLADDLDLMSTPIVRAAIFSMLLVVGVWSLKGGERYFKIGMSLVVAGVLLNVLAATTGSAPLLYASFVAMVAFLLVAIAFTLRQVVVGMEITFNRLVGAICVYLLLGVIWAFAYSILELAAPGSFTGFSPWADAAWDSEWLYFSFVTMTTLGYGDIAPIAATARSLAYMQAIFGQFYIAILVASLVGAYVSNKSQS